MASHRRNSHPEPPAFIEAQLTAPAEKPPEGDEWAHEIKLDGYRLHARIVDGKVQLLTRRALDWTERYVSVAAALARLPLRSAYIDGEICALRADGTTSFADLQAATDQKRSDRLIYYAFDLLFIDGEDIRHLPLRERKKRLQAILPVSPSQIRFADHQIGSGGKFHEIACRMRLEGTISKRLDKAYAPGNRGLWVKTKCVNEEEFVIVGFTDPEGSRQHFGALLLGYYTPDGELLYAGRCGSGMNDAELKRIDAKLKPLLTRKMPLDEMPSTTRRYGNPLDLKHAHWVKPDFVVQVRYLNWTADGVLRQAAYEGLREDKPAREVIRERPGETAQLAAETAPVKPPLKRRTPSENIERELEGGLAPGKDLLTQYWQAVWREALKHLGNRPLKLVRALDRGKPFYHTGALPPLPPAVHKITVEKRGGGIGERVWVDDLEGLLGLVAIDVVELHPWGALIDDIEHPNLLVIDLEPGDGIAWDFVIETALALRDVLTKAGYKSWCKTSGREDLHLMIPVEPRLTWDEARGWTKQLVDAFAKRDPRYITIASAQARAGKLYLDYLRNGRGSTAIGAYSPVARPGFPIAYPVTWKEVEEGITWDRFKLADFLEKPARVPRKK